MTLDPQVAAYLERVAAAGAPPVWEQELGAARLAYGATAQELWGPADPLDAEEDVVLDGPGGPLPVRLYRPAPAADGARGCLVFLHGGGWVLGDLVSHGPLARGLAARSGAIVASVDYRLAPEHPFPAALDDAWTALRWATGPAAAAHGIDPARVAVGGDSAGGNLAAACALRARDAGIALRLQLLVYPVTDARTDTPSYVANSDGFGLTRGAMEWYWAQYAPGEAERALECCSPLRAASLAGVAPAHVLTAQHDVLRDDGDLYAARLAAAGVPVEHRVWDGMNHGFLRLPGIVDRAAEAVDACAEALRAALA